MSSDPEKRYCTKTSSALRRRQRAQRQDLRASRQLGLEQSTAWDWDGIMHGNWEHGFDRSPSGQKSGPVRATVVA